MDKFPGEWDIYANLKLSSQMTCIAFKKKLIKCSGCKYAPMDKFTTIMSYHYNGNDKGV